MNREDRALVKETKTLIKEVEAGDTAPAAWVAIQDRVNQLYKAFGSYKAVGREIGKDDKWVSGVVAWERGSAAAPTPWATTAPAGRQARAASNRSAAKKVLADPAERVKVIEGLTPDEKAAVVRDISDSASPPEPEPEVTMPDLDEAVAADLTAQVAKLVHTASRIEVLRAEHGATFKRIDAGEAGRLDNDLERTERTVRELRVELLKHRGAEVS
jgi:hypothetical protein